VALCRGGSAISLFVAACGLFGSRAEFGHQVALRYCVKQLDKRGDTTMATEKKSLVSKKTAPATKGKSSKKVDTSKPAASKVVSARSVAGKGEF
jgi:hypothetical protein